MSTQLSQLLSDSKAALKHLVHLHKCLELIISLGQAPDFCLTPQNRLNKEYLAICQPCSTTSCILALT